VKNQNITSLQRGDYVTIKTGKNAGLCVTICKVNQQKVYFNILEASDHPGAYKVIHSWTKLDNIEKIRETYITAHEIEIEEYYFDEVCSYFNLHPNAGIWADNGVFCLVSDINNGNTEIALIRKNTFDKLRMQNIIGANTYSGHKRRGIFPQYRDKTHYTFACAGKDLDNELYWKWMGKNILDV